MCTIDAFLRISVLFPSTPRHRRGKPLWALVVLGADHTATLALVACTIQSVAVHSAQISPYEIEAEERKHGSAKEDVHILRANKRSAYNHDQARADGPSPLDPPNHIPAQPKRVRRVQKPTLCPLEHIPLIHQPVKHLPSLGEKVVDPCLSLL